MRGYLAESGVEEVCLEYFADLGWQVLHGPDIAPDQPGAERSSYRDLLLEGRLRAAVCRSSAGTRAETPGTIGLAWRLRPPGTQRLRRGQPAQRRAGQPPSWTRWVVLTLQAQPTQCKQSVNSAEQTTSKRT